MNQSQMGVLHNLVAQILNRPTTTDVYRMVALSKDSVTNMDSDSVHIV